MDPNANTYGVENLNINDQYQQQQPQHHGRNKKKRAHAYHQFGQETAQSPYDIGQPGQPPQTQTMNQFQSQSQPQQFQQQFNHYNHQPLNNDYHRHVQSPWHAQVRPSTPLEEVAAQSEQFRPSPGIPPQQQIPSIVGDRNAVLESLGDYPQFKTFENALPPPAGTQYEVVDQGISGPNFARLTMYNVPTNEQLRQSTHLPLGLLVQPFAPGQDVHVCDFSDTEPPRCRRCRTYINPSMMFIQGGAKFVCNMCQYANEVTADYYQPTDNSNRRIDWEQRPELAYGTYDLAVPKEFWKDEVEPSPLHHLFMIDVTAESIQKEIPKLAIEAIRETLYGQSSGYPTKDAKIGIATFDRTVHFYNLHSKLSSAQQYVMSDLDDPFVPIEGGLFVDANESRQVIEDLLDRLDKMFADTVVSEPAYGAALLSAKAALEKTGGKVSIVLSTLPTWGPGALFVRDESQYKSETHNDLLKASSQFYIKIGEDFANAGIGIDSFLFPTHYIDMANTGKPTRTSGGQEHCYPRFVPQRDGKKFVAEFVKSNSGEIATQCMLKVRCSNGLQVHQYKANMYQQNIETDPLFGSVGSNTTIGVMFKYDGKLDMKLDAHFQFALLYTSSCGQRRVRVINILAAVTEQYKAVLNFVDVDAVMGVATRDALSKMGEVPLKEIRAGLTEKVVEVFASYRKHTGSNQPPTQLLMPLSLRSLVIYFLALSKSRPIRASQLLSDNRLHAARLMNSMNSDMLALYLYPRIIGLHNLRELDCTRQQVQQPDGSFEPIGRFIMPVNVEASINAMEDGGAYLVYNGQGLILWIQKLVNPQLLEDLFGPGVRDLNDIDTYLGELPVLDTEINIKSRALVEFFALRTHVSFLGIQLARQGIDGAEFDYHSMLVEDRNMDTFNYTDYVSHVHRNVKIYLENKNSKGASHLLNETINMAHGNI